MTNLNNRFLYFFLCIVITCTLSCTTRGPAGLFGKKTPHESYSDKITDAGLKETALGRSWFLAAENSLNKALSITIPYSEAGYFAAAKPDAVGVRFKAKRGEKLDVRLTKNPATGFSIYMDLWQADNEAAKPKLLLASDTSKQSLDYEVKRDGFYIVRLQPELLASGQYNLSISTGPSLAFPVPAKAKPRIGSFWGDGRDAGARKHEGVDIFAPFRTPLVAAADGTVTSVSENNLGGKVVFLRPHNKDYTLYYAHLDEQLVNRGEFLQSGDTLGLMGNTGNARTTAPHLHFGIYTNGGAIDPLAFINPVQKQPSQITASLNHLGKLVRTDNEKLKVFGAPQATPSNFVNVEPHSLLQVQAATAGWYKVELPDGRRGYITSSSVASIQSPLKKITASADLPVLDAPVNEAPAKRIVNKGTTVNVLAAFKDYYYISTNQEEGWIPKGK